MGWLERETRRLVILRRMVSWCPGLRQVRPGIWGLGLGEFMERWFRAMPVEAKTHIRPGWSVARYWERMPMARIKLREGGHAFLLQGQRSPT